MKKSLLSFFFGCAALGILAQSVPNGSFENWTTSQFENPNYYYTSNYDNGGLPPYTVLKTSDAFSGTYAIQLSTLLVGADTANSFIANGDPSNPVGQGIPYTEQATGITGYYKGNYVGGDSSLMWIIFKKAGNIIGNYIYKIGTNQTNYTQFSFTFSPALPQAPDSMIFAMTSSNLLVYRGSPGTTFQADSIAFTGVASQPVNFNGDFELWSNIPFNQLNQWETSSNGTNKSNDSYAGNFALELMTITESGNAKRAVATNGKGYQGGTWGGSPYSTQIDTLVFYYKFSAQDANDSAQVNISFKNNAVTFQTISILLKDTGFYRRVEVPFNLSQAPDTVLYFIHSSMGWGSIPLSYAGGVLKIDNMFLKSQLGAVTAFTSPATGCTGQPIQLMDNSGNIPIFWNWAMPGGNPSTSALQNPVVTYTTAGTYTISLRADNMYGSGATVDHTITISNPPVVTVSSPTMCLGDSAIIIASGASTYQWSNLAMGDSITVFPGSTTQYTVTGMQSGCSASATATVTVINCTSSISNVTKNDATVFPSPFSESLFISASASSSVEIFDLTGKKVFEQRVGTGKTRLDLSHLTEGIYFVQIRSANGILRQKITKLN